MWWYNHIWWISKFFVYSKIKICYIIWFISKLSWRWTLRVKKTLAFCPWKYFAFFTNSAKYSYIKKIAWICGGFYCEVVWLRFPNWSTITGFAAVNTTSFLYAKIMHFLTVGYGDRQFFQNSFYLSIVVDYKNVLDEHFHHR